ncbi:MAG: DNA/RNA non-specific endonuclease [Alphaproteobacteria bacterium]
MRASNTQKHPSGDGGRISRLSPYARPQGKADPGGLVQRLPLTNTPGLAGQWFVFPAGGRALEGEAYNLVGVPGKNNASRPSKSPKSWKQYRAWKMVHPSVKPGYVRMHLISDRLGGSGAMADNLAPGTNGMNQRHFHGCENPLIKALKNGGSVLEYKVKSVYNGPSPNLVTKKGKAAWRNAMTSIKCSGKYKKTAAAAKFSYLRRTVKERLFLDVNPNWVGK